MVVYLSVWGSRGSGRTGGNHNQNVLYVYTIYMYIGIVFPIYWNIYMEYIYSNIYY